MRYLGHAEAPEVPPAQPGMMSNAEHMSHEEYLARQRDRARAVAREVLSGDLSAIAGARVIARLDLPQDDQDVCVLRLVECETDNLPIGEERQHWTAAALARKADEIARAESWAREIALTAFKNVAEGPD